MENSKQHIGDFLWLDGDYLLTRIESDNNTTFKVYDTKHSIFPKGDYAEDGFSNFKKLGSYSFEVTNLDNPKFGDFVKSLTNKNIIRDLSLYPDFFSISVPEIKNPDDYQFLKLHVSASSSISRGKIEEFVNKLKDEDFHRSNNRVYINNWVHIFLGIDKPYNFDGLKVNEVEYDTSVFLKFNTSDDDIKSNWNTIRASLMSARH